MAIVVIGGQTRNIGKTSVVCALISALSAQGWTAIKISQHEHDVYTSNPEHCLATNHNFSVSEEPDASNGTDSSRYLAAGAVRSLWVRTRHGQLAEAMPRIRAEMSHAENIILESNSVLSFIKPDVYASVLDPSVDDFKSSALYYLHRANALLIPANSGMEHRLPEVTLKLIEHIPRFEVAPPDYFSPDLARYVADKLGYVAIIR